MSAFDNTLGPRPKKNPTVADPDAPAALGTAAVPLGPLSTLGAPRSHVPDGTPPTPLSSAPTQPLIKRPQDPALAALQTGYAPVRQGFDAANAQVQGLTQKRDALQGVVHPDLVIPRNDFAPVTQVSSTPGGVTALQAVTSQLGQATHARDAYIPKLNAAAQSFRDYTDRTNADALLRQAGLAPLPSPASFPSAPATTPARIPAVEGTPASPGGISASAPAARANFSNVQGSPLAPGDANTFTFSNGKTVPVPGMTAQATTATMNAPLALPSPYAPAPVATPNLAVNLPRPVVADSYNTRQANEDMGRIADTIDSQLFRNSFAVDRGSRSARDLQGQLLGTLAALGGRRLDVAANVAGGNRDAAAGYDLSAARLNAENQQALLKDQGDTLRTGMDVAGKDRQAYLGTLAEMQRAASDVTDADGNLLRVSGFGARPVLDQNGNQVQTASKNLAPDANTIVREYDERQKAIDEAAALTGKPSDYTALDASPLGQAYRQVFAGSRTPTTADVAKLRAHPEWASYFDQNFGKGAASRVLGGTK